MKNQIKLVLILLAGLPIITSCGKNESAGPITIQTRTVSAFNEVEVRGDFDVQIVEGENFDIEISAPQNVLPYIQTSVYDTRLVIDESNNRIKDSQVTIRISNTSLKRLEMTGSGKISGAAISSPNIDIVLSGSGLIDIPVECDEADIDLSGSGRIQIYGSATQVNYDLSGSGSIDARTIDCGMASADLSGSGNIQLFVSDTLFATVCGSGSILYWGSPEIVNTHVTGSGSIIHQ